MAATVAVGVGSEPAVSRVPGNRREAGATVTFDTSYPTGGYALTAGQFGLQTLDKVNVQAMSQLGTHLCLWNMTTGKLQVFTAVGTEVSNTTDIHTDSVVVSASGL